MLCQRWDQQIDGWFAVLRAFLLIFLELHVVVVLYGTTVGQYAFYKLLGGLFAGKFKVGGKVKYP